MATSFSYLAVIKASYDYEPQSEDEIAIKEDQILFLLEKTDEDWWKVKVKDGDEESEGGLVPAAYVEELPHKSVVKALYDYDASAPGELSIKEDEELYAYDKDDDWLLVQRGKDGGAGFVPANYVEDFDGEPEEEEPSMVDASAIVVPPSPPRPTAPYVDPAERVAQTPSRAQVDSVQTWAVSEVDKKGKKKKGTLGIGSGAIFFASESDKTPVQKWQTADVESHRIEKSKHVYIEVGGPSPTSLHYSAGSKDIAEAIIAKLDSSKRASSSSPTPRSPSPRAIKTPSPVYDSEPEDEPTPARESPKLKKNGVNVHFATSPPSIISPREPSEDGDADIYQHTNGHSKVDDGQEWVTVLYDFEADGVDELSVHEGDRLVVLERDNDEWWKVRDMEGNEGVVPASYVELDVVDQSGTGSRATTTATQDDEAEREREAAEQARREEETREREKREAEARLREERERKQRVEAERRAKAKAEAAEAERKRKEQKEEEEARRRLHEEQEEAARKRAARESRSATSSGSRSKDSRTSTVSPPRDASSKSRTSTDGKPRMPSPSRTRTWHDRTGQFKVDAEYLGYSNGKLRLHKVNGVVIEVPAEKMSAEDMRYIESMSGKKDKGKAQDRERSRVPKSPMSDDDVPLAERRKSLHQESRASPKPALPKKTIDWFEFFLNAGCDVDDCTRYAHSFDRDKMDESILPDITEQTMRTLGLREGDIIRVKKAIAQRVASSSSGGPSAVDEQVMRDEELARQLQNEENGGRSTPKRQTTAPNLFSLPGGALKNNTRRGRPQPKGSTPPATVDLLSLSTASEQINRNGSPVINVTTSPTSITSPQRASSAAPVVGGFDDDAWTNRPTSTQPIASSPPAQVTARAPSAPPQTTPVAAPAPQPAAPAAVQSPPPAPAAPPPPAQTQSQTGGSLAKTTESDIFDQLARMTALRTQSPAVASPAAQAPASAPVSAVSPPPVSFQNGLGMGASPVPLGQLQAQATGFPGAFGPRGPLAPVPANQGLLQPLVPTTTGFNSFVPTRPASNPPQFNTPSPQPSFLSTQPTGFTGPQFQPTSFLTSQPTGFQSPFNAQPTGFPTSGPMVSQTTSYPGALGSGPFAGGRPFSALQPNVTGFNPNFGPVSSPPPVPPVPPLPSSPAKDTTPANIFAAMKSGTFGDDTAPQPSNRYDALRPQPTGWGVQGATPGYQNGYSGPFY